MLWLAAAAAAAAASLAVPVPAWVLLHRPVAALARVLPGTGNLAEGLVQGQVVADRVLGEREIKEG